MLFWNVRLNSGNWNGSVGSMVLLLFIWLD